MAYDRDQLNVEFYTDPQGIGYGPYLEKADDWTLQALLNAKNRVGLIHVPMSTYAKWLSASGARPKIKQGESSENPIVSGACSLAIDLVVSPVFEEFIFNDPDTQNMILGLQLAGILTQDDVDSLEAVCTGPISRGEELFGFGYEATLQQCGEARN